MAEITKQKAAFSAKEYSGVFLPRYVSDPVKFSKEICGIEPCEWQIDFLTELARPKPDGTRIALASGHETGKTYIVCVAMLWGVCVFPDCHMYATSATRDQLETRLWSYMKQIIGDSQVSLWFDVDTKKAVFKHIPGNAIFCQSWKKDNPQSWAGEHCYSAWGVFDECSDIDSSIFESWSGSAYHAGSRTILLGQPRLRHGILFKSSHDPEFNVEHVSCEGIESQADFVKKAEKEYGEESDYYRIRVKGLFPRSDSATMFPDSHLKAVEELEPGNEAACAGFDVAGEGSDKSVLAIRKGSTVVKITKYDTGDHVLIESLVLAEMRCHSCKAIAIDANGIGHGLSQYLAYHEKDLTVISVVGSKKARKEKKYHNRRSEAYGELADIWKDLRFSKNGVAQEDLTNLCKQLAAVRNYLDKDMRTTVLPKQEMKKELQGASPDLGDALAYCALVGDAGARHEARRARNESVRDRVRRINHSSNPYREAG
jgi:hypothetical protein